MKCYYKMYNVGTTWRLDLLVLAESFTTDIDIYIIHLHISIAPYPVAFN